MVKSIRVSSEAGSRLPSGAKQWYIMAKWIKERCAEVYVARVDMASASCRYLVISALRADRGGWGGGAQLLWVHAPGMPAY